MALSDLMGFRIGRFGIVAILLAAVVCSPAGPSDGPNIDGIYLLTVTVSDACTAVPEELHTRTFTATITGSPRATVTLAGGTFWQHPTHGLLNRFQAVADSSSIGFLLGQSNGYGVIEQVGPAVFMEMTGSGKGGVGGGLATAPGVITGTVSGVVRHGEDLRGARHIGCPGAAMTLRFERGKTAGTDVGIEPGIASVEIVGPPTVPPGLARAFAVIGRLADGSSRTLSGAAWSTSNGAVLRADSDGSVTGRQAGESTLRAVVPLSNIGNFTASRELIVLPDGTFRLIGRVNEAGTSGSLPAARVEVASGVGAGLSATTDATGSYRLYGVAGDATIRVSRLGYEPLERRVTVNAHTSLDFELTLIGPRTEIAGTYDLTIETTRCGASSRPIAEPLRRRSYRAVITQAGSTVEVRLAGSRFFVDQAGNGERFHGRVEPDGAVFTLDPANFGFYYEFVEYPDVAELLSDTKMLAISGTAVATHSREGLSGTLTGHFIQYTVGFYPFEEASCRATGDRFTLTRVN